MDKQVMIRNCTFAYKCSVNWETLEETDRFNDFGGIVTTGMPCIPKLSDFDSGS